MITLNHSACLLFAGSFDPAYFLTISAVPDLVKPTINKRNAALIQRFFDEELSVPQDRGVINFLAIPEENLATNGVTVAAEIDKLAQGASSADVMGPLASLSRRVTMTKKRQSQLPSKLLTPPTSPTEPVPPTPTFADLQKTFSGGNAGQMDVDISKIPIPETPSQTPMDLKAEKIKKMSKRRSFLHILGGK
jgi:hypothetical protein